MSSGYEQSSNFQVHISQIIIPEALKLIIWQDIVAIQDSEEVRVNKYLSLANTMEFPEVHFELTKPFITYWVYAECQFLKMSKIVCLLNLGKYSVEL